MACEQANIWPAELWKQLVSPAQQQQQEAGSNHWLFWQQMSSLAMEISLRKFLAAGTYWLALPPPYGIHRRHRTTVGPWELFQSFTSSTLRTASFVCIIDCIIDCIYCTVWLFYYVARMSFIDTRPLWCISWHPTLHYLFYHYYFLSFALLGWHSMMPGFLSHLMPHPLTVCIPITPVCTYCTRQVLNLSRFSWPVL